MPAPPSSLAVTESPIGVALLSWEYDPATPANFITTTTTAMTAVLKHLATI